MSIDQPNQFHQEALKLIYQEVCNTYRHIEDFRTKVLGLLPIFTGTSFLTSIFTQQQKGSLPKLLIPIGALGILVTLGLFCYEVENLKRSALLAKRGQALEMAMNIQGIFSVHPRSLFNKRNAAGLIYSSSVSAWLCLGLWPSINLLALIIALFSLVISSFSMFPLLERSYLQATFLHTTD